MVTFSILLLIGLLGGVIALIDGVQRARGRGTAVLAIIEIVVAALFLLSLFLPGIPFGSLVLAVVTLIVLTVQLVLRGGRKRAGIGLTVAAIILLVVWIVLVQNWLVIPGVN
ncbi:hypothetical protein [Orlajensenia leifsoniae]|uniref:Uncharacterized protein n=1 Tax=Orlajensenia leifsoniae TaxID=2561933 RepID=A0A4Y9QW10_9MICO|nr:hypothetical protein [Leifsonia flava]TFV96659.1 hypothetical protein E4M00_11265 [Leifsonia flava]